MQSRVVSLRARPPLVAACATFLFACNAYDSTLLSRRDDSLQSDAGAAMHDAAAGHVDAAADGDIATECSDDPEHPTCVRPHAQTTCASNLCFVISCEPPFVDCDGQSDNGCEGRLDSPENCGLCGAACRLDHAEAGCIEGGCVLARCKPGYGNCDSNPDNGCETALDDIASCGSCSRQCEAEAHATAGCVAGTCGVGACIGAFGDCNLDPEDGCEQRLDVNAHCASCDGKCEPAHGSGSCASGDCVIEDCSAPYVDCNGLVGDGCEVTLTSVEHCGSCGNNCQLPHAQRQKCDDSTATVACAVDHHCYPDVPGCSEGAKQNGCEPGFSDCDGDPKNGCETDLTRLSDCGSCGNSCVMTGTVTECVAGGCQTIGCVPGYDRCGATNSCASLASDAAHCGACETSCSGTTPNCAGGKCTGQACAAGTADCDGMSGNGCEASLSGANDCGVCGNTCAALPHAVPACVAGACTIGSCNDGFADCDHDASNGCEVDTRTANDCGACGKSCSLANGTSSCATGTCMLTGCDQGRGNCNATAADGCEADLTLPDSCGACGNDCSSIPNVLSSGCSAQGKCQYVCVDGRADCDKKPENGCEAVLTSTSSCGSCGNDCRTLPHVSSASCGSGGVCKSLVCDSGWDDCNGDPSDGCERSLHSNSDCGACNQACAPAHGNGSCSTGTCQVTSCDSGYDDCNDSATDGCEALLSSPTTCGSCTKKCPSGLACSNGQCTCSKDADCGGGTSKCCGNVCTDAGGACFPWPCIPGTQRTNNANCGGCGMACGLFCCTTPPM